MIPVAHSFAPRDVMPNRALTSLLFCVCALAPVGCTSTQPSARPPPAVGVPPPSFDYLFPKPGEDGRVACPMSLPGVHVTAIPTDAGSLLVFTSADGHHAVRRRARALSEELSRRDLAGVATSARYEEIPEGATVEVMADQRQNALALRDEVDRIAREMQRDRDCPPALIAAR
jgi:hypothetical protein